MPPKKKLPTGPTKDGILAGLSATQRALVKPDPETPLPESLDLTPIAQPPGSSEPEVVVSELPLELNLVTEMDLVSDPVEGKDPAEPVAEAETLKTLNAPDRREADPVDLGSLSLQLPPETIEKLHDLATHLKISPDILVRVMIEGWDLVPPANQQLLMAQATKLSVEKLLNRQSQTMASIERLLAEV